MKSGTVGKLYWIGKAQFIVAVIQALQMYAKTRETPVCIFVRELPPGIDNVGGIPIKSSNRVTPSHIFIAAKIGD